MTYVLIHGAGDVAWYWHLVAAALREHATIYSSSSSALPRRSMFAARPSSL